MKRPIAMMAVLSTAAMMAALTPATFTADPAASALAASNAGWVEEDGKLRYVDSDGYYQTNTWKRKDGDMYYLDEEGEIAVNTIIDDEYYVDENGKRVADYWVSVENEDDWDSFDAPEFYWHYFGRDGKAVKSKWFKINNNWYYFDAEGRMLTGKQEIDGSTYYLGGENDGVRKTGWIQLNDTDSDDPDNSSNWYYFDNSGRMVENQIDRKIDGHHYSFIDGKMQTGWLKLPAEALAAQTADLEAAGTEAAGTEAAGTEAAADTETGSTEAAAAEAQGETAEASQAEPAAGAAETTTASVQEAYKPGTIHGYQYYDEDGKRASGWYEIEGAEGVSTESEVYRFYFRSGKPLAAENGVQVFTIDSKKYAFNEKGEMQTGKQVITLEDGQIANAYFGADGVMRTGKQTIYDEDLGENQTWFFHTDGSQKGQGFHGIRDNAIYIYGLRQQADNDLRYDTVEFDGNAYLVNASGSIQKASSTSKSTEKPDLGNGFKDIKDGNGKVWIVDVNGIVQK